VQPGNQYETSDFKRGNTFMKRRSMMKSAVLSTAALSFTSGAETQPKLPDVEIRMHNGRPTVFIDGVPNALPAFNTHGKKAFDRSMPLAYKNKHGVYVISPESYKNWPGTRFWVGDQISSTPIDTTGEIFDLDEQAEHIIKGDPDGWIMVCCAYIRPPDSWRDLHPQEYFIAEDGSVNRVPSLASDLFSEAAAKFSRALIEYCESRPWANRVICYFNYGVTEGVHWPVFDDWFFDHNPLMVQKFRDFLRKKYDKVEKLRTAYCDNTLTFDTIDVPKEKLRGPAVDVANILYWQDAKDNRPLRDYLELQRELFLGNMRKNGEAMQGAVKRKMIFLHDSLKQVMLGWSMNGFFNYSGGGGEGYSWPFAFPETMAGSGSMDVMSLFDSPGFSGLLTPLDYQARGIGGVSLPEGAADSCVLRGKYFFSHMDMRTWIGYKNEIGLARTIQEYAAISWRNLATGWTRGFGTYWIEFGSGWFDPDDIRAVMHEQVRAIKESLHWKHETIPGIAMILDDTSVLETNGSGNYLNEAVMWEQKMGIARCGVPHNIYLFEDLELDNFPRHRVYYFPNLFRVDDKRLEILRKKVFRDGAVVVWGPGSGISNGDKIGVESAKKLTGFEFEMISANAQRRIHISNFDHPVARGMSASEILGGPLAYGPVLMPLDGVEIGIAWAKGGFNHIGMAVKDFGKGAAQSISGINSRGEGDYSAIFTTAVNLPAQFWRNTSRWAGAHIWSETDDVLLADSSVVFIHSIKSERKRITLPGKFKITDIITGKPFSKNASEIIFELKAPETRVFLMEE
jgi:hypothetical protein